MTHVLAERVLQDTLKAWYRQHYTAPAMRLVLYSRETPDWYAHAVPALFGPIPAGPSPPTHINGTRPPLPPLRQAVFAPVRAAICEVARVFLLYSHLRWSTSTHVCACACACVFPSCSAC
jgi:hypothetical protein